MHILLFATLLPSLVVAQSGASNLPPFFSEPTPAEGSSVAVFERVAANITLVADDNGPGQSGNVSIAVNFVGIGFSQASIRNFTIAPVAGVGSGNLLTVLLQVNLSAFFVSADLRICATATDRDATNPRASPPRCFNLEIVDPPLLSAVPSTATFDVGQSQSIQIAASSRNAGADVDIAFDISSTLPSGLSLTPRTCPTSPCANPTRALLYRPLAADRGQIFRICLIAVDNSGLRFRGVANQTGGQLVAAVSGACPSGSIARPGGGPLRCEVRPACVSVFVEATLPSFLDPTPTAAVSAVINCRIAFTVVSWLNNRTLSLSLTSPLPAGATLTPATQTAITQAGEVIPPPLFATPPPLTPPDPLRRHNLLCVDPPTRFRGPKRHPLLPRSRRGPTDPRTLCHRAGAALRDVFARGGHPPERRRRVGDVVAADLGRKRRHWSVLTSSSFFH